MDETSKIYCTDGNCNAAAMAALMNNNNSNQWNNPFCYLVWMMFANRFWNNGENGTNTQNAEVMSRLNELGSQISNNQNTNLTMDAINGNHEALHTLQNSLGVDFATLQGAVNGVQNAITQVGGQVGMTGQQVINSVLLGNKDLEATLQSCCCQNKMLVQQMGYEGQLRDQANTAALTSRIDQLANGVQTGFAQVGYAAAQNTSAIIQAANANTQRIIDQMNSNNVQELRDKLAQMSQDAQTASIVAQLKSSGCSCS